MKNSRRRRAPAASSAPRPIHILDAGYRSTHYWVVGRDGARLLVDLGWPGSLGQMRAALKRLGVPLADLRYGLATHYHIDHAGLAQELKDLGMPLLVLENQLAAIPMMKRWTKPHDNYTDISLEGNVVIGFGQSRALLAGMGLAGEIVPTPGHSDDSVSLLLDDGSVFTGDLPPAQYATDDEAGRLTAESWRMLQARGARRVYPAHGGPYELGG